MNWDMTFRKQSSCNDFSDDGAYIVENCSYIIH